MRCARCSATVRAGCTGMLRLNALRLCLCVRSCEHVALRAPSCITPLSTREWAEMQLNWPPLVSAPPFRIASCIQYNFAADS